MNASEEPCPVCGIPPSDELEPAAYEAIWEALPDLKAAQEAGEETYCRECGRQLTFPEWPGGVK